MIIIQETLGNESDAAWAERLKGARIDLLNLDQWEAQKSRLRKATAGNVEVALSLSRSTLLRDGDILDWDASAERAIVVRIALNDVMVVDIEGLKAQDHETVIRAMFELGHALGNQHWPAIIKGGRVYVPLTVDRKVMSSVMKTHAFPHVHYTFVSGNEVLPYMTPHEARRLFGGASQPSHSHERGGAHSHGLEHSHSRAEHAHAHGAGNGGGG